MGIFLIDKPIPIVNLSQLGLLYSGNTKMHAPLEAWQQTASCPSKSLIPLPHGKYPAIPLP